MKIDIKTVKALNLLSFEERRSELFDIDLRR